MECCQNIVVIDPSRLAKLIGQVDWCFGHITRPLLKVTVFAGSHSATRYEKVET